MAIATTTGTNKYIWEGDGGSVRFKVLNITGLTASANKHGVAFCAQSVGGMFGLYFSKTPPTSYAEVMKCDKEAFNRFFHAMLDAGHYLAPSAFEAGFVSAAHTEADIAATVAAADKIFAAWK